MTGNLNIKQSLSFTETMRGFYTNNTEDISKPLDKISFVKSYESGKEAKTSLDFTLTIEIDDLNAFSNDPQMQARAVGVVVMDGKSYEVEKGLFNLFIRPRAGRDYDESKEMNYTLYFRDENGNPFTFFGYKSIEREEGPEVWEETTTLYTYIWKGHHEYSDDLKDIVATGILRIYIEDFVQQMKSMNVTGSNILERTEGLFKFMNLFASSLWEAYSPFVFGTDSKRWDEHIFPLETTMGVSQKEISKLEFNTDDGLRLSMSRFKNKETKEVVLLLHGLTNSTDMFIMPEIKNIVNHLGDNGFDDIFSLDWRGSNRHKYNLIPNRYNLDDIAAFDMPAAIDEIIKHTSEDVNIHVIAHCIGSVTFMAALSTGKVKNIKSVISNSVSLTPKVGWQAKLKLKFGPFLFEKILSYPYFSPMMPYMPGTFFGKWIYWLERVLSLSCKEPACHMISFMWGWGFPAAYEHKNITTLTHRRLKDLFGGTTFHYYRHIYKMVKSKIGSVPFDRKGVHSNLPKSYLNNMKMVELPSILFVSGDQNHIFPGSNKLSYEKLHEVCPDADINYIEFKGYGHQDVFIGKNCHKEVFPEFINFIKKHIN